MAGDLIVYYSLTGETERVANIIAASYNCDTVRLAPEDAGKGTVVMLRYFLRNLLRRPLITIPKLYFPDYEQVYIGCPVWAGSPASPMAYFVEKTSFASVDVIPFVTHESNDPHKAIDALADSIRSRGGKVLSTHTFKKGLPKDLILGELEGKEYTPEKTPDADLSKFKT